MNMKVLLLLTSALTFVAVPRTDAAVIINALGGGALSGNEDALDASGKAVGFTMGTSAYTLDNLQVRMRRNTESATTTPTMTIALYSSTEVSAGEFRPGTQLLTFTTPTLPTGVGATSSVVYTLTPSLANFVLSAGTSYWIVAYIENSGSATIWKHGNADVFNNGTSALDASATAGTQAGLSFTAGTDTLTNPTTWSGLNNNFNDLALNATLVPEPSAALLSLAGAGLMVLRRRK